MCQLFLGKNSELQKDVYPGCQRLFMGGFRFRSSLKSDPRVFPLLSFLLFLFFFKLTRVFSRGPHPAKAPRRTLSQTDILPNGRYVICWAVLILLFFLVRLFPLCKSCNENFPTFSPATKRLENNWAKATSSSRLFVCRSSFLAVYCWSHFTGCCKRYWRIRNLSQSESVKYLEWILSGVMLRSCRSVFLKYVSRHSIANFWAEVGSRIHVLILCCLASCKEI